MLRILFFFTISIALHGCFQKNNSELIYEGKNISGYFDKRSYNQNDSAFFFYSDCEATELYDTLIDSVVIPTYKLKYFISDINRNIIDSIYLLPKCKYNTNDKPWENGFGYDSVQIKIPELPSGIYLINNKIPFIIKNNKEVDIAVLYPTNTINAYNSSGGKNLYRSSLPKDSLDQVSNSARIVSFLRPLEIPIQQYAEEFFKWANNQEYQMDYMADEDLEDYSNLQNKKLLIITGHNEYWTRNARKNVDKFVENGGNLLILSGNVMWWQVRLNKEKSNLICYKEIELDPFDEIIYKTVNWNEPYLEYSIINSIGADFSYGGYGNFEKDKGWDGYKVLRPNSPIFKNTNLAFEDVFSLLTSEYDGVPLKNNSDKNIPIIDNDLLNFYKIELLAYDYGYRLKKHTTGTFIVFKKTANSGTVINTASTNWCSNTGIGGKDSVIVRKITKNMIDLLLEPNSMLFTDN